MGRGGEGKGEGWVWVSEFFLLFYVSLDKGKLDVEIKETLTI